MNLKLHQFRPAGYTVAAILTSIGGVLNGLDTGSIGAITVMPAFRESFGELSPVMRGFTVSLIMLTGALPSPFAGQIADCFGRLPTIGAGTIVFIIGVILQATCFSLAQLLVGRAIAGFGEVIWLSNVAVYIAKISPRAMRGVYVAGPSFGIVAGIFIGYFACYGTERIPSSAAWRTPYIIQGLLALILRISCLLLPASPRWLVLHGHESKAMEAVERLGLQKEEAEKDILAVKASEHQQLEVSSLGALIAIFQKQYRSQTMLGLFVLGMVQLSGIDGILFYSPILFQQAGLPAASAGFIASGVSAILMLMISVPALLFADRWGRRTYVITGGISLSSCMFLIGILYAAGVVHPYGAARWVVIVSIFLFAIAYNGAWGVVGKIYASEIQPAKTRAAATCVAQGLGFFTNWLVGFITPIFLAKSSYGPYFLYGGLTCATMGVLVIYMPETRGRSLENIQEGFELAPGAQRLKGLTSRATTIRSKQSSQSSSPDDSSGENISAFSTGPGLEMAR